MNQYISDTKFAAEKLIDLIREEEELLSEMREEYLRRKQSHEHLLTDFNTKDLQEDFNEHEVMHAFGRQARYYQEKVKPILDEVHTLEDSMKNKEFSICALSGALLQIAKQGISYVHGGLDACQDGRMIRGDVLKNVIWYGRNQSLHFEEGNYRKPLIACFRKLGYKTVPSYLAP